MLTFSCAGEKGNIYFGLGGATMKGLTSVIYNVCDTAGTKLHHIYVALCQQEIGKLEALQRINEVRDSLVNLMEVKGSEMTRTAKKRLTDMINLSNSYIRKIG